MSNAAQEETRQEMFSGTKEVAGQLQFDVKRLEDYMKSHVEGFKGPLSVLQFKGGQSNPTYQLVTSTKKYVMRRKPPGNLLPSAHAVDREYTVITALGKTDFPVAKTYALCTDPEIAGTMFFIMEMVEGRILWEPPMPGVDKEMRWKTYDSMNATLAKLHSVDYKAVGLSEYGRPGNYFARQISRWTKQYRASEDGTVTSMEKLIEWLPENIPAGETTGIVHGDYSMHNMIMHPTEPKVLAVLDWELSTLGDPLADFTYGLQQWVARPLLKGESTSLLSQVDVKALGIPTMDDYIKMYCDRTGRKGIDNLDFYFAFNFFRSAAIRQGIKGRVKEGSASNAHAAEVGSTVAPLADDAWDYAKRAGAK